MEEQIFSFGTEFLENKETVRLGLSILFLVVFSIFMVTFVTSMYHLRRYSLTMKHAIRAEVAYLVISFFPMLLMTYLLLTF